MKTILLSLLLLAAAPCTFSQITGSGSPNRIPKFGASGTSIGNSQLYDDGTLVGIGASGLSYKVNVEHNSFQVMRLKTTTGSAVLDIDGFNGYAYLRLLSAGAGQWNVRTIPPANDFEIYDPSIATGRLRILKTNGNIGIGITTPTARLHVNGTITSTGAKAFTIDHPLDPENKMLHHFAIESNEVLNSYSGNAVTNEKGMAQVQLPAYFETINKDFRYQLTVIGSFAQAIVQREIKNNNFEIATSQPNVKVSWEVKAVRNDAYMQKMNMMKEEEMKTGSMKGRYIEPAAYGLPESRGVNYNANDEKLPNVAVPAPSEEKEKTVVKN